VILERIFADLQRHKNVHNHVQNPNATGSFTFVTEALFSP